MNGNKMTAAGLVVGWGSWFFSHMAQINGLMQFLVFTASLILTIIAILHKLRSARR